MHRTIQVDMSAAAIDQRLRDVSQLRKLGLSLAGARYLGKVKDLEVNPSKIENSSEQGR
jgi:hypothetical protein